MKFSGMDVDGWKFLIELKQHNEKMWFETQKDRYRRHLKQPAERLLEELQLQLERLTGHPMQGKIFRIHRDLRFSKDKTPYNTHLRMAIHRTQPNGPLNPSYFFSLEPERLVLGCGVFDFGKEALNAFRSGVAGNQGLELERLEARLKQSGFHFHEPDLKRVPRGYSADHPRARWLRYKGYSAWREDRVPNELFGEHAVPFCMGHYQSLLPLAGWLESTE